MRKIINSFLWLGRRFATDKTTTASMHTRFILNFSSCSCCRIENMQWSRLRMPKMKKKDGAKELKKRRERGVKRLNWWQREWSCVRIKYTLFLSTLLIWQIHKLHITQLAAAALPLEKSISQVFVLPKKSLSPPILLRVRTLSVSVSRVQFLEKKMLKHNNNNHHDVDGGGGCDDEKEKERRNINLGAISMPVHDTDNWTTHTTLQIDHFV